MKMFIFCKWVVGEEASAFQKVGLCQMEPTAATQNYSKLFILPYEDKEHC